MGSRREDEKNEATIRRLLKLPENKRCINCNSMGPQYVCTIFSTFVCTQCSGIHREFSHRIKSVSMAKFTAAEVAALQAGGNERARQILFRSLDPAHNSLPDSGSPDKLRDFIKRVYEKRLYSGDRPPIARQEEPAVEVRRPDAKVERSSDLRSLSFEDYVGDKNSYNRRKSDFDRSPKDRRGSPKSSEAAGRPTRHSYDERDERIEEQSPKSNGREKRNLSRPFSFRDFDITPPPAQSITDLLGDIPGLRVEVFKLPNGDPVDSPHGSSVEGRKALQSQSFGAVGDDRVTPAPLAHKRINSASLIDINDGETGATATGVSRGTEDPFAETSQVSPTTSDSWATFNASPTPPAPPGYPAPTSENSQWAESGWGKPQADTLDAWSSFGTPSPPQGVSNQEHFSAISPSGSQSSSGQPQRQRRELPQNFFAPSFEDGSLTHLDMQRGQQMQPVFQPPQLDAAMEAYYNMEGLPQNSHMQLQAQADQAQAPAQALASTSTSVQDHGQMQLQPQMQPQALELSPQMPLQPPTPMQRSRNPFDDDFEDDSSASRASSAATGFSMQFPSMDTLQAALPPAMPVSSGVSAMEVVPTTVPQTLPTNAASPDWAYSFAQFNDSTSLSGSFDFGPDQPTSSFQMPLFTMQPNVREGYMATHPFAQEAPYPGNQFYTHNVVRPAGGNPFG